MRPYVVTTGGRKYNDASAISLVLSAINEERFTILHGGASGADALVDQIARRLGFSVEVMRADWYQLGNAAGPVRNRQMLDMEPAFLVAFPGGAGTRHCIYEAKKRGILILTVDAFGLQWGE